MTTCGGYDYAGESLVRVGLPAMSGISGGIAAALPGQLGGRPRAHRELLDREGSTIRLHELTGDEGFASTELLVRRVLEDQTSARWQVLDLRRVSRVDTAGRTLLAGLLHRLAEDDVATALVEPRSPSARATLRDLPGQVARFSDMQAALEWCETQLLEEAHGLTSDLPGRPRPL